MTDFYDDDYDDLDSDSDEELEGGEGDGDDSGNGESWGPLLTPRPALHPRASELPQPRTDLPASLTITNFSSSTILLRRYANLFRTPSY